ncbi:hypothetical protein [Pseudophaeobacter sp. C1-32P7]|uniref:hypothetical protein n=1 Tax=Pseudophaeobacter sp. C1-32P7 TaxID=3098142 RepID=UPI0034D4640E
MTEKSATSFVLNHDRLASASDDYAAEPTFKACLNAHGMYETMRFVLRLSPRNHELMERIESNEFETSAAPVDVVQAYSTYIHETIHNAEVWIMPRRSPKPVVQREDWRGMSA